jgi:hypothetical protein
VWGYRKGGIFELFYKVVLIEIRDILHGRMKKRKNLVKFLGFQHRSLYGGDITHWAGKQET